MLISANIKGVAKKTHFSYFLLSIFHVKCILSNHFGSWPIKYEKLNMHCATPCKIAASTDKNGQNENKNRTANRIWKVRFLLQHPLDMYYKAYSLLIWPNLCRCVLLISPNLIWPNLCVYCSSDRTYKCIDNFTNQNMYC